MKNFASPAENMDVNKLEEDELSYELKVRGIAAMNDANEMRSVLRGLLKIEAEGNSLVTTDGAGSVDVKTEVKTCVKKLQVINAMIDSIQGDRYGEQYRSVDAKLCHLMNRVDKLPAVDAQDKKERSNLLKGILFLMRKMEAMASNASSSSVVETNQNENAAGKANRTPVGRKRFKATKGALLRPMKYKTYVFKRKPAR